VRAALLVLLALAGCATPDARQRCRVVVGHWSCFHEVPFADGRTLSLGFDHSQVWHRRQARGRAAVGFRVPRIGDLVVVRTVRGVVPGEVVGIDGASCAVLLTRPSWKGMSGAGVWYTDDTVAGAVQTANVRDPRLVWAVRPPGEALLDGGVPCSD
jgi:hypothetical protein